MASDYRIYRGDCLEVLRALPAESVDAIVTDPPYPGVKRPYGYWTEEDWFAMMRPLVAELRRILRPSGSAMFVLQAGSQRLGRMRTWLWDFQSWLGRDWGIVQDAYWWNHCTPPTAGCQRTVGLLRPSLKTCVWAGPPDCYRDQDAVLWTETQRSIAAGAAARAGRVKQPSGISVDRSRIRLSAIERGGVTPYNVLPIANAHATHAQGHPAATPLALCEWWVRYISPPGGVVLDPFMGSGTTGVSCMRTGRSFVGIERDPGYYAIADRRIREARKELSAA